MANVVIGGDWFSSFFESGLWCKIIFDVLLIWNVYLPDTPKQEWYNFLNVSIQNNERVFLKTIVKENTL